MQIQSLEHIYMEYHNVLLKRALVIVGDVIKAEDVIHDVFLRLLERPKKWHKISNKKAYLLQSVTNQALNHWKSNQKLIVLDSVEPSEHGDPKVTHLEDEEDLEMFKRTLEWCLSKLTPRQQLIFSLSRYEGLDHEEIATHLAISKNTVKNQLVTVLTFLRAHLQGNSNN